MENEKENLRLNLSTKENALEKSKNSIGSSAWNNSINESAIKQRGVIQERLILKNRKSSQRLSISKQSRKSVKKIKQSSIKKHSNTNTNLSFANKVIKSVKNAGTSRVSYNQIFYTNKPKSSLKKYTNALKSYLPKKKSTCIESNSSAQLTCVFK